jgi:hypothetical protein
VDFLLRHELLKSATLAIPGACDGEIAAKSLEKPGKLKKIQFWRQVEPSSPIAM